MPRRKKDEQDVPQQDDIKTDLTKRRLFHEFTEDDIHILNEKIAELTEKKEKFSEEAKTVQAIVKGTDGEIKKALAAKNEGGEDRDMECPVIINYTQGTYTVKHPETGIVIESRPLKDEERQPDLFPEEETDKKEPGEDNAAEDLAQAEEMQDGAETLLDEAHAADEPAEPAENEPEEE